ncbi:hypothetical protein [Pontibacillus litoralis]|uniref:Uncharacterized protein n=1 Tax=Pontibacillus litoralis JSM 072002 TaxID=1385512 RepID=A0A0A5G805_9BACI|nr:hypothetical protein [Pontibacillus litoralis]KGX87240.1 hypothetical protein N784_16055 [Pontibacillus litoralis JSM 072002]
MLNKLKYVLGGLFLIMIVAEWFMNIDWLTAICSFLLLLITLRERRPYFEPLTLREKIASLILFISMIVLIVGSMYVSNALLDRWIPFPWLNYISSVIGIIIIVLCGSLLFNKLMVLVTKGKLNLEE